MIHQDIYSKRNIHLSNREPYVFSFRDVQIQDSFSIFFTKYWYQRGFLSKAIKDFCQTERFYLSANAKSHTLYNQNYNLEDFLFDIKNLLRVCPKEYVLDFLEICINILGDCNLGYECEVDFIDELNLTFAHNNMGFCVIDGIIVTKESDYLHQEVICKSLTLLIDNEFAGPLNEFEIALDMYTKNDYEHSIIEACKAFESTMKCILVKKKISYDPSISTASKLVSLLKDNGILDSYLDDSLNKVIGILTSGLPVIRNKQSGHGDGMDVHIVEKGYASLALNIAGSYIVFLIDRYYDE